jgi:hypothetical protein
VGLRRATDFLKLRLWNRDGDSSLRFGKGRYGTIMKVSGLAMGIVALIVGILVLGFPDLLRWIVGIGLVVVGLLAILRK